MSAQRDSNQTPADAARVLVAVIDSGWDPNRAHPRVLPGPCVLRSGRGAAEDRVGHGTASASVLLRFAPDVCVLPVRVFDGEMRTHIHTVVAGIDEAVRLGAQVLNLGLGTTSEVGLDELGRACEHAEDRGAIVVAAADTHGRVAYPAELPTVVGVAFCEAERPGWFGYRESARVKWVANGVHHAVPWLRGRRVDTASSSFSAPVVSAFAARIVAAHPDAGPDAIRKLLSERGRDHGGRRVATSTRTGTP